MKLNISKKLFLGYLAMAFLTIISSVYAVVGLRHLNDYTHRIIRGNVVVVEGSKLLMNSLVERESAFMKFVVIKDDTFINIFWEKGVEFKKALAEIKASGAVNVRTVEQILAINNDYEAFCAMIQARKQAVKVAKIDAQVQRQSRAFVEDMAKIVGEMQRASQEDTEKQMAAINKTTERTFRVTLVIAACSLLIGIGLALFLAYNISRPLKRLENAAVLVGQGEFDHNIKIESDDEIGSLARTFSKMMEKLKVLEAVSLDASPLTGLPGNLAIEREVKKRLLRDDPFALCHVDLDNFKPFVDRYGYAWGSEVIKEVANILINRVKTPRDDDAFIGHIGGDDFVIIAPTDSAERMCQTLVREFAPNLSSFYSEEDRERGYITGKDRKGKMHQFPLITVTISIVTNRDDNFADPLEMAKKAAQIKEFGKTIAGSNCVHYADFIAANA